MTIYHNIVVVSNPSRLLHSFTFTDNTDVGRAVASTRNVVTFIFRLMISSEIRKGQWYKHK